MTPLFQPIRWRLVAWFVAVLGLILVVLGTALYVTLGQSLMSELDQGLMANSEQAQASLEELAETGHFDAEGYRGGHFSVVVGADGTVLANPQGVPVEALPAALFSSGSGTFSTLDLGRESVRVYARPVEMAGVPPSTLVVGVDLGPERELLRRLLLELLVGAGAALALAVVGGWFLAGRALVPIQSAMETQQAFVADASHELRAPLSIMRSATDLLDQHGDEPLRRNRALFEDVRREIAHMERLSSDLLTLARSDQRQLPLAMGLVQLGALAAELERRAVPMARERGVTLDVVVGSTPPVVDGDPGRLHQVGLILIDNALQHTPRGGQVMLLVRREGVSGVLEVRDSGEGIARHHLDRIFDRFYRADRARSRAAGGTGLGLAIARALVTAHGGQLLVFSQEGRGTCALMRLPLAREAPASVG